jgi:DNA topoisomerase-1
MDKKSKKTLVIVESPAKAKTINKFLGNNFKVTATVGHIIDLPKTTLGVDLENGYTPKYVTIKGKSKIIGELKKEASQVGQVLLATDPDREGEAIAFHITETINPVNKNILRVEFNEITKNAVLEAVSHPRPINSQRVFAQQARRVMDRIVGYQVSPFLWQTIFSGLSAGRVQSVALKLVCEREEEINRFESVEYWTVDALLKTVHNDLIKARLVSIDGKLLDTQKFRIANSSEAEKYKKELLTENYVLTRIEQKNIKKHPPAPFITSTMQQEASRRLRMTTSRIMSIAQQLYEGVNLGKEGNVGLITYMRTDSTRISLEAIKGIRNFILETYGQDYLPPKANIYSKRKAAQDAHEAIRPTYLNKKYEPQALKEYLTRDQYKLYELIWRRFLASQLKPAEVEKTILFIDAGKYGFKAEGDVIKFRGYLVAYEDQPEENGDKLEKREDLIKIPANLSENEKLKLEDLLVEQRFTQPPSRFTESTLVRALDKLGIGRPSTYAQIISTLFTRKYVDRMERKLIPTDLGQTVNQLLTKYFPNIFDVKFTAQMEDNLDKIEQGRSDYQKTLDEFYLPFESTLKKVKNKKSDIKKELQEGTELSCDVCGKPMIIRWGRNGRFYACSGYPECRNTKPLEEPKAKDSDETCEKCGSPMLIKRGKFGEFLACSNYPTCKNTRPISTKVKCPEDQCDGEIVQRQSKKGKIFYSCSNYPQCKFALWDRPINETCPECGAPFMLEKVSRNKEYYLQCHSCKHKKIVEILA